MNYAFYNAIITYITLQNDIPYSSTKALGVQNGYFFTNTENHFMVEK